MMHTCHSCDMGVVIAASMYIVVMDMCAHECASFIHACSSYVLTIRRYFCLLKFIYFPIGADLTFNEYTIDSGY